MVYEESFLTRPAGLRHGYFTDLGGAGMPGAAAVGDQWAGSNWSIARHQHPIWELYFHADGHPSRWDVDGVILEVGPGDLLLVPPRTDHELLEPRPVRCHFTFAQLDPDLILGADTEAAAVWRSGMPLVLRDAAWCAWPFALFMEHVVTSSALRLDSLRAAAQLLLITVADHVASESRTVASEHPSVSKAITIIRSRFAEPLRVADIAAEVGLSSAYFSTLFHRVMGQTPVAYRMAVRLEHARRLLVESTLDVSEVAQATGFSSSQHLATTIKGALGRTPSQIRRSG